MSTSTSDLTQYMRKYNKGCFLGVFARDKIPSFRLQGDCNAVPQHVHSRYHHYCLIVNTDSSNLPGTHWIAIKVYQDLSAVYFDPYGFIPSKAICSQFPHVHTFLYTLTHSQNLLLPHCGQHCVYFLYNDKPASSDCEALNFINKYVI